MLTAKQLKAALIKKVASKSSLARMSKYDVLSLIKDTYTDLLEIEAEAMAASEVIKCQVPKT
ncbi:MAG: hypothetical protein BWX92_02887 [Deltaproteobacteria bacterium ADurb.Bin135]|jgi:hypothetical protein|nr:MAG: hypothetical protein BWX92_02887 [Deltaproteobacteria bacterium ADurb.Bin135]